MKLRSSNHRLSLQLDGVDFELTDVDTDFGMISIFIKMQNNLPKLDVDAVYDMRIISDEEVIFSGSFKLARIENLNFVFTHPQLEDAMFLRPFVDNEVFLRKNRYAVLEKDVSNELFSQHVTELKDFLIAIDAGIYIGSSRYKLRFDFSSNSKILHSLEFSTSSQDLTSLISAKDTKVTVQYSFIGKMFYFESTIKDVDLDFGVLSIEMPIKIFALCYRHFDRIKVSGEFRKFDISEADVNGEFIDVSSRFVFASIEDSTKLSVSQEYTLRALNGKDTFKAQLRELGSEFALFEVLETPSNLFGYAKFVSQILPVGIEPRKPDNYEALFSAYENAGYLDACATTSDIKAICFENWHSLDRMVPLNVLGKMEEDGTMSSTVGCMPFTKNMSYAHSLVMEKTVTSAVSAFRMLSLCVTLCDLHRGVKYIGGSYKRSAKYSSKLHLNFTYGQLPEMQYVIEASRIWKKDLDSKLLSDRLLHEYRIVDSEEAGVSYLDKFFYDPNPDYGDVAKTRKCIIERGEERYLLYICETAKFSTASNVLRLAWILPKDRSVVDDDLVRYIVAKFSAVDLVQVSSLSNEALKVKVLGVDAVHCFWTVTHKTDYPLYLASLLRTTVQLLEKYGEHGIELLKEVA